MNPQKALWEMGNFSRVAETVRESSRSIVQSLNITPGLKVLDLGCGDGNTAIPAAELGADVTGVDIATNLLAFATKRAADADVSSRCRFQEGDAVSLQGFEDSQFDMVISFFGAMFSPKPFEVAKEMVRVAKKTGGRIVMGNWSSVTSAFSFRGGQIMSKYTPPPPEGSISPLNWGLESDIIERFEAAGVPREKVKVEDAILTIRFQGTPADLVDVFRGSAGPFILGFKAAEAAGRAEELRKELEDLYTELNESKDPSTICIPATFTLVKIEL